MNTIILKNPQNESTDFWDRTCSHCSAILLQGESKEFCCQGGKSIVPPLPPLPTRISSLTSGFLHTKLSSYSRRLNNLFSFTAIGVTGSFAHFQSGIASVAVTGRIYHRMLDVSQSNHSFHWFLYDEEERKNQGLAWDIPQEWIDNVQQDLQEINPYVGNLRLFHTENPQSKTALELSDFSSNGDFAAIIHASNNVTVSPRHILIWRNSDSQPSFIPIYSQHYEPLQYPLLFPHGSPGWGLTNNKNEHCRKFTQTQWYRGLLLTDKRFNTFGRLTSEYICDMYCRVEEQRLQYIRNNRESSQSGNQTLQSKDNLALPSSFLGSRRWASEQSADGLALARHFGRPSFFITMTCNPDWPEIQTQLTSGQNASDVPVIVARVFKQRLQSFIRILRTKFSSIVYLIKVIEFQKRGLPHAHLIIKIDPEVPLSHLDDLISCRLPENNPRLREKIKKYMSHNRNHLSRETSRCNRNGKCIYGFPHPLTQSTYIDEHNGRVHYKRCHPDEQWIAPHIPELIDLFDCHIYWDVVFTVHVFMYLYKYLFKGPDYVWFQMQQTDADNFDEIKDYVNGRYLSAPEAAWRILNFDITSKEPSVICLPIHLQDANTPQFNQGSRSTSSASNLTRYFYRPLDPQFDNILYMEYYEQYIRYPYNEGDELSANDFLEQRIPSIPNVYKICRRKRNIKIARLKILPPSAGEAFYLRAILHHKAGRSYEDLKNINGVVYPTFHEAAIALGIFQDINEGYFALLEAVSSYCTPSQLRFLFTRLILEGYPAWPLWDTFFMDLSLDFRTNTRSDEIGLDLTLQNISSQLTENHRSLSDFGLPVLSEHATLNHLDEVITEHEYNAQSITALQGDMDSQKSRMTPEQCQIFDYLLNYVYNPSTSPKFLEGKPGRGKTFLIDTLATHLRSQDQVVLIVATSAIAALMYDRAQTAHAMFKIPVTDDNNNVASLIKPNTNRAHLILHASCIIWDELPLANRSVLESVNDICQSLRRNYKPFGGIPFIGVGDFRQVAPVVKGQGISATLLASIKSSPLWKFFEILTLHNPIRSAMDLEFSAMLDIIGEDSLHDKVKLPILAKTSSIHDTIQFLFPLHVLTNVSSVWKRAFLSPLNAYVDEFNQTILHMIHSASTFYYSADVVKENNDTVLDHPEATRDYLTMMTSPGIPPHELELKIGCVCTLMRNMSIQKGLVKNAKVIIHNLGSKVVEIQLINNKTGQLGEVHYLPRIRFDFTPPHVTWTIQRLQFPLRLAYATTFHSCIGSTLDKVTLDLRSPVFTHGQLYTACSRVRSRQDLLILQENDDMEYLHTNIVYQNLLLP